jgi:WD40 repeat protein
VDGKYVLSGSADRTARLWHVASGQQLWSLTGHTDGVRCVAL